MDHPGSVSHWSEQRLLATHRMLVNMGLLLKKVAPGINTGKWPTDQQVDETSQWLKTAIKVNNKSLEPRPRANRSSNWFIYLDLFSSRMLCHYLVHTTPVIHEHHAKYMFMCFLYRHRLSKFSWWPTHKECHLQLEVHEAARPKHWGSPFHWTGLAIGSSDWSSRYDNRRCPAMIGYR